MRDQRPRLGKNKTNGRATTGNQSQVDTLEKKNGFGSGKAERWKNGCSDEHGNRRVKEKTFGKTNDQAVVIRVRSIRMQGVVKPFRDRQAHQPKPEAEHQKSNRSSSDSPGAT